MVAVLVSMRWPEPSYKSIITCTVSKGARELFRMRPLACRMSYFRAVDSHQDDTTSRSGFGVLRALNPVVIQIAATTPAAIIRARNGTIRRLRIPEFPRLHFGQSQPKVPPVISA
jgi:hypothetical protein